MGNRQMNESDIMNSHTLMRLIYCRHQQGGGGPMRRQGAGGCGDGSAQTNERHTHGYTDTHTDARTQQHT